MTETKRIRWEPTGHGGFTGHVGVLAAESWLFQIWNAAPVGEWQLDSTLPGNFNRATGADPDDLKVEAERLLSEFVSSLGAIFPKETQAPPETHTCRHCGGEIVPCPAAHRIMVPACEGWKHVQFIDSMPIGAHYCEGRSVRPSAEPAPPHPGDRSSWPTADELAEMSMHDQEMWERRCADGEGAGTSAPRAGEKE